MFKFANNTDTIFELALSAVSRSLSTKKPGLPPRREFERAWRWAFFLAGRGLARPEAVGMARELSERHSRPFFFRNQAELAIAGFTTPRGVPYSASAVSLMLAA